MLKKSSHNWKVLLIDIRWMYKISGCTPLNVHSDLLYNKGSVVLWNKQGQCFLSRLLCDWCRYIEANLTAGTHSSGLFSPLCIFPEVKDNSEQSGEKKKTLINKRSHSRWLSVKSLKKWIPWQGNSRRKEWQKSDPVTSGWDNMTPESVTYTYSYVVM